MASVSAVFPVVVLFLAFTVMAFVAGLV